MGRDQAIEERNPSSNSYEPGNINSIEPVVQVVHVGRHEPLKDYPVLKEDLQAAFSNCNAERTVLSHHTPEAYYDGIANGDNQEWDHSEDGE
eukprot:CAMPEP_0170482066 /NCGR_PEP_ID=MMETSP0208-20121228/2248_1 /TAXON_ID=197538 /ORGANISM="Strombidium inclinatum, Strain S3" /LENGTH=91 /DNA_ID=CAMNT_0010754863 /DNA_START=919 /DNA_END=1194 /DNA_ORIENTATION=-